MGVEIVGSIGVSVEHKGSSVDVDVEDGKIGKQDQRKSVFS